MTPANIEKKIGRIKERISEIDKRIKELEAAKRDFEKQISELQNEEMMYYVRNSNLTIEEIADALEFGRLMKQSGTSKEDVADLLGVQSKPKAPTEKETVHPNNGEDTDLELSTFIGGLKNEI